MRFRQNGPDRFFVRPMRDHNPTRAGGITTISSTTDANANLWSVFVEHPDASHSLVKDFKTKDAAYAFVDRLGLETAVDCKACDATHFSVPHTDQIGDAFAVSVGIALAAAFEISVETLTAPAPGRAQAVLRPRHAFNLCLFSHGLELAVIAARIGRDRSSVYSSLMRAHALWDKDQLWRTKTTFALRVVRKDFPQLTLKSPAGAVAIRERADG
ncbi:MAG: hypothetical protein AAFR28_00235 [Pseudomonadota bacterium]